MSEEVQRNELAEVFTASAPFVNRIVATTSGQILRLAFAEVSQEAGILSVRGAVAMTVEDGMQLRDLLDKVLPSRQ